MAFECHEFRVSWRQEPGPGENPRSRRAFPAFRPAPRVRQAEASSSASEEVPGDRGPRPDQALRPDNGGRSAELRRPPRRRHRLPRAERVRQVHHHAPDPGPGRGRPRRHGQDRRPRLPRPAVPAPRGRRAARGQGLPPGPQRQGAPDRAGRQQRHPGNPGGRGAPLGRSADRSQPQGRPALPGHGPAAGHRRRAARRSARPHPRRAGQRPGPGGDPLDQEPDEVAGRRGPDRVRLQPPDRRDGADRRAPHRHRGRPAAGRHHGGRTLRQEHIPRGRVPRTHLRQRRVPRRREQLMTTHYRFRHVARMEWIKLRTLRSVRWTLLFALAGMIGIGIAAGFNTRNPRGDVTSNILVGGALGSVLFAVLGVLVMTSEYSSGTIRATLAAVELVTFAGFLAGAAFVHGGVPRPALSQPDVLRAVALSGAYLCLIGLIGLALGVIVRHAAAAITALVGLVFVAPLAGLAATPAGKFLPELIYANSLGATIPLQGFSLSPWAGLGLIAAYAVALLAVGGWLLTRRDA